MKVILIHNPEAGSQTQPSGEELTAMIVGAGHEVRYQSCRRAEWREALLEPADLIAIAGGDGIVGMVATELIGRNATATILPMGTANNVARALHLRGRKLQDLISDWRDARRRRFDIGVATGPWGSSCFIEGMGIGAFTETMARLDARKNIDLAHHAETEKKIESVLHIMSIRLEDARPLPLKLRLDGVEYAGDYVLLEAMNIASIGPNLELAPDADPGDGLLDVVLLDHREQEQLREYLARRLRGRAEPPRLPTHKVRRMRVECDELRVHIDDDIWPEQGEHPPYSPMIFEVGIHPEKIEILVPAKEPAERL